MKKYLYSTLFLLSIIHLNAQVAIGKQSISSPSVSLEFGNEVGNPAKQKGLLLPWVDEAQNVSLPTPGSIVFDISDKKIKYYKGGATNQWKDLTYNNTGIVNTTAQKDETSSSKAKVSIGKPTDTAGILVLEDNNKAMILPLIDSYESIINPSPGMIAYDLEHNLLCVFNGKDWTFLAADEEI